MNHHPIFARFTGYSGPVPEGMFFDWIGAKFRTDYTRRSTSPARAKMTAPLPALNEEYFEWIDLLEAVCDAEGRFVMFELGAGFGRWGVRGALACRQLGIESEIHCVEAEPQHVEWLHEAMAINEITRATCCPKAISYTATQVPFAIGYQDYDARTWYGQAIVSGESSPTDRTYFGKPVSRNVDGYDQIIVDAVTLEEIVKDVEIIDLIDMDLQGAEGELVRGSIGTLSEKVKRVHIGTHSEALEAEIRDVFTRAGWAKIWDFGCQQDCPTPYGQTRFNDGVQGWTNPRFGRAKP